VVSQFDFAISLGPTCRTAHQLRRLFGRERAISSVFDWQITPPGALLSYLASDFAGMFEIPDLTIVGGVVINRRYRTEHHHEFPKNCTGRDLAEHYFLARNRHVHLCDNIRRLLAKDCRVLCVLSSAATEGDRQLTESAFRKLSPRCSIEVVLVEDAVGDLVDWHGDDAVWDAALGHYHR
jgi:hypothetical protein